MKKFSGLLLIMMAGAGCQPSVSPDYHKLDLATVDGTIRLAGKPLANHNIIFQDASGTFSFGKSDRQGRYRLQFNSEKEGVLIGEKTVRIRRRGFSEAELFPQQAIKPTETEDSLEIAGDMDSMNPPDESVADDNEPLPNSYHVNSKIKATVVDGHQTIDFDLKADGSTTTPAN